MVNTSGIISTIGGSGKFGNGGDGGEALDATMYFPCSVAVDPTGNVYLIDNLNDRIRLLTPDVAPATTDTTTGTPSGSPNKPILPVRRVVTRPARAE
jgi:hypothetical protein